jgi:flagellar basal body-associated protein FliL
MPIIFLVIPIFALFAVVIVAYLIMTTKKSRSFYDGNKYVEPTPLQPGDEGTTA